MHDIDPPFADDPNGCFPFAQLLMRVRAGDTGAWPDLIGLSRGVLEQSCARLFVTGTEDEMDATALTESVLEAVRREVHTFTDASWELWQVWLDQLLCRELTGADFAAIPADAPRADQVGNAATGAVIENERHAAEPGDKESQAVTRIEGVAPQQLTSKTPEQVGRFEIVGLLGVGGMGRVYLANDPLLRRKIAFKVPHPGLLTQQTTREQFIREAQASGQLRHPNIVAVYESGEISDVCYIATQYCEGPTLAEWLKGRDRPVPVRLAARIMIQLSMAMQHAHDRGILHRDLKPGNVLLDRLSTEDSQGQPVESGFPYICRISDFGLAQIEDEGKSLFQTGVAFGTAAYMAPEQARGERQLLGPRTDVYALGGLLYELLTGKSAFDRPTLAATLAAVQEGDAVSPRRLRREIPRDLESICMRAMGRLREQRYASCGQLADDLQRFLQGHPTSARPIGLPRRVMKWARRRPAQAGLAIFAHLAFLVAIIAGMWHHQILEETLGHATNMRSRALSAEHAAKEREQKLLVELYANDISLAHQAWKDGDVRYATKLLQRYIPQPGVEETDRLTDGKPVAVESTRVIEQGSTEAAMDRLDLRGWEWYWLWDNVRADRTERHVSDANLYFTRFSPQGTELAVVGQDATLYILDAETLDILRAFKTGQREVNSVVFGSNGETVVTSGDDGSACIWDLTSGQCQARFEHPETKLFCALFFDDDTRLITCGESATVFVWDISSGELVRQLFGHNRTIESITLDPSGKLLASASSDKTVCLWNPATGELIRTLQQRQDRLTSVSISSDGRLVAAGDIEGHVLVWSVETGELVLDRPLLDAVECLAFDPHLPWLTVGTRSGGLLHVGPFENGRQRDVSDDMVTRSTFHWQAHESRIYGVAYSPDGRWLASVGSDGSLRRWAPRYRGKAHEGHYAATSPVLAATPIPDSDKILVSGPDSLGIINLSTHAYQHLDDIAIREARQLAVTRTGGTFVVAGVEPELYFGNLDTGVHRESMGTHLRASKFQFTADGQWLIVDFDGEEIGFIDVARRQVVQTHKVENLECLLVSPDGRWLVAGDGNRLVRWDLRTIPTDKPTTFGRHEGTVSGLAFDATGTRMASSGEDRRVKIWNWPTLTVQRTLEGIRHAPSCLAFSADGKTLFSCGRRVPLIVWNVKTGRQLFQLHANETVDLFVGPYAGQIAGRTRDDRCWFIDFPSPMD